MKVSRAFFTRGGTAQTAVSMALALLFAQAHADGPAPQPADPAPVNSRSTPEPAIERITLEDDNTRIEELKVRGETKRITISSKGRIKSHYEILTGDGSRDLSPGVDTNRGAAGQRVWSVFDF